MLDGILFFHQLVNHAIKNKEVEGQHGAPIGPPPKPAGAEGGRLGKRRGIVFFNNFELQPCFAGQFHFGEKQQPLLRPVGDKHTPEVEGIAGTEFVGVGTPPPQSDAAHYFVEQAPYFPYTVAVVPNSLSAYATVSVECMF